jgi:putative membrane-bound dehydrogenase-like protein
MNRLFIALFGILILFFVFACSEKRYSDSLTAEEALESFKLKAGFKIEIFATEPHVMDPVDMVFDEQGNIYVVEMPDYPAMPEHGQGRGRIKVLQDNDHDGRIDSSIIFADSLLDATSVMPWNGGLIVTSAPHIYFLKDTDGDMRADQKEVLFSGFFENNSEAQITSLRQGIDNWIYAANNGQAGDVTFSRRQDAPAQSVRGTDFRFRLDRNLFEPETGAAQFGLTMDDWGNRFMTQNTLHIRQAVIPWRYLHRHAHAPSASSLVNVSDHELEMFQLTPPPYWRAERTSRRQKQYKEQNLDRVEYAEDHFTGASGGTIYAGDGFPEEYYGNVFTGDVAGNLVHRDVLVALDDSPTFVARRDQAESDREFLASTDSWFRPVNFAYGPDGFLYVIDMYRQHIETPLSIPEDLKEDMDFLNGTELGRIYRIVPENASPRKDGNTNIREMNSAECVALLKHPNRWWRLQAQRMLIERQDLSIINDLKDLLAEGEDARARLHALYTLEVLNSLNSQLVREAMHDRHPGVRQHAARLSEQYSELLPDLLKSANDSSIWVAFQSTLSLGDFSGSQVTDALRACCSGMAMFAGFSWPC